MPERSRLRSLRMAKSKTGTVFYCQNCGYESSKWMGQCPGCKEWNSMVEEKVHTGAGTKRGGVRSVQGSGSVKPSNLSEVSI